MAKTDLVDVSDSAEVDWVVNEPAPERATEPIRVSAETDSEQRGELPTTDASASLALAAAALLASGGGLTLASRRR